MKLLTAKKVKNSWKLFDRNGILIGERLAGIFAGTNVRLKINNHIYKVKSSGFLYRKYEFFDHNEKLVLMIDRDKK